MPRSLKYYTHTKESQASLSPERALELLQLGNQRFLDGDIIERSYEDQIRLTTSGQYPFAVILSCIDSRIPVEIVFDQGIGDIFNARIAGNFINRDILGSMEFACKLAGAKLVVILGHSSCGAVKGACDHAELGNLTAMLDNIKPALEKVKTDDGVDRSSKNISFVDQVAVENVHIAIDELKNNSPVLEEMRKAGEIDVVGAMYDVASGSVRFL